MRFAIWNRACVLVLAIAVVSCGPSKKAESVERYSFPTEAPIPPPRYDQEDNGTYYYVATVSEEEQKKGKVAGDALGFRYLGKNEKGENVIEAVSSNGTAIGRSYCMDPCKVIREPSGRVGFNPTSIIGAVFEDAMNGHLRQYGKASAPLQTNDPTAPNSAASPALGGELSLWPGRYTGTFEGNADGDITVSAAPGGKLKVSIGVGGDSCAGGIDGNGMLKAGQVVLSKPRDDSGHACKVTLYRRGDRIDVSEDGCSFYHGAFCSFNGSVRRR